MTRTPTHAVSAGPASRSTDDRQQEPKRAERITRNVFISSATANDNIALGIAIGRSNTGQGTGMVQKTTKKQAFGP